MNESMSKNAIEKNIAWTLAIFAGLFVLSICGPKLPDTGTLAFAKEIISQAHGTHSFGAQGETNGYYEDLMQKKPPRLGALPIQWLIHDKQTLDEVREGDLYLLGGFLRYFPKPNMSFSNTVEGQVETNSYGFFDQEWPLQKSTDTRRIAFIGDSVTRGWGVPMDERYTSIFTNKLNSQGDGHFEVLNLAVPGYLLTQMFDVVNEKAGVFHPDVYILGITELTGGTSWSTHMLQLINDGGDLKYDFLRQAEKQAGVEKGEPLDVGRSKLSPYRQELMRELFLQVKTLAENRSAKLIVIFVPTPEDQHVLEESAPGLEDCLKGTGIPVINLFDTYRGKDIANLRLNWHDPHPTALGHQLIAQNLYNKLRQNPEAWAAITGMPDHSSAAKGTN